MKIIEGIHGRIIFCFLCFGISSVSNKQLEAAVKTGRKIVVFGRSMERYIVNGIELCTIKVPAGTIIEPK